MALLAGCPRCTAPVFERGSGWACGDHGPITPLWRPAEASYDDFGELLGRSRDFPLYLPWPMSPGWSVTDFGIVGAPGRVRASVTCCSGASELDGPVDVFVITEEAGTGLGARCASTVHTDPGNEVGDGPPPVRIRIGSQSVPLWLVSTSAADDRFDRSVFAGEAGGRWLWIVLRPASAMLLLRDEWILRDASGIGPEMLELTFGGNPPAW
ncbi:conserved hypothetical protein [metagenome]|uniref:Uncharacterized protein n=1 Tax=metagenome TaxID=256318 RepID=A0A2P2CG84_9ZZZZ